MANKHSALYLEGAPEAALDIHDRARELSDLDFQVVSPWHGKPGSSLREEILKLVGCDIMLLFPGGARQSTWVKVGFAAASGLRIICVGGAGLAPDLKQFFSFTVESWDDLARNNFLKLGDGFYRKLTRT